MKKQQFYPFIFILSFVLFVSATIHKGEKQKNEHLNIPVFNVVNPTSVNYDFVPKNYVYSVINANFYNQHFTNILTNDTTPFMFRNTTEGFRAGTKKLAAIGTKKNRRALKSRGFSAYQAKTIHKQIACLDSSFLSLPATKRIDAMLSASMRFLGTVYRWGGKSERGFDCLWLTVTIFKQIGYKLPGNANSMSRCGVAVQKKDLKKGDILFFKGRNSRSSRIGHVATVSEVKNGEVFFIHASCRRGVILTSLNSDYYRLRYIKSRRVVI